MATGGDCRQGGPLRVARRSRSQPCRATVDARPSRRPATPDRVDRAAPLLDRKRRGAWYTPHWLVEHLLDVVLDPVLRRGPPAQACGARSGLRRRPLPRRRGGPHRPALRCEPGRDRPAWSASTSTPRRRPRRGERLGPEATIVVGDALRTVRPGARSTSSSATRRSSTSSPAPPRAGAAREHGGGPYADAAVEFLALALRLARPDGGRVGLVLPTVAARHPRRRRRAPSGCRRSAASTGCGGRRRDGLRRPGAHRGRRLRARRAPAVRAALAAARPATSCPSGRRHRARPAADLVAPAGRRRRDPRRRAGTDGVLADRATVTADFRDQYYGLIAVRPRRARRRRRSSRPGCSTRAAARGASDRPASAAAATSARASTWPPSCRRRPARGVDRRLAWCRRCSGHPDRRHRGAVDAARHLAPERARWCR